MAFWIRIAFRQGQLLLLQGRTLLTKIQFNTSSRTIFQPSLLTLVCKNLSTMSTNFRIMVHLICASMSHMYEIHVSYVVCSTGC